MGFTDWRNCVFAPVLTLVALEDGIVGEVADVGIRVAPGRGVVGTGDDVEDVEAVGVGGHQAADSTVGRSQRSIRRRKVGGKMCLGTIPWTALGGIEV